MAQGRDSFLGSITMSGRVLDGQQLEALAAQLDQKQSMSLLLGLSCVLLACLAMALLYQLQQHKYEREKAVTGLHQLDPEILRQLLGGDYLPSWARFPDVVRSEWVNVVVQALWGHIDRAGCKWAWAHLESLLNSTDFWRPKWLAVGGVKLRGIFLGQVPPTVTGIKVYCQEHQPKDELSMEYDFAWQSKMEVKLTMRVAPEKRFPIVGRAINAISRAILVKVGVRDLVVRGRIRATMRPLLDEIPVVGAVKLSLVEAPVFSHQVRVFGGNPLWVPGLEAWIQSFIKNQVLRPFIFPEGFVLRLADVAGAERERPQGLLEVRVIEAVNVPRMDLFNASDPYVKLCVQERLRVHTSVKSNTRHPIWDETYTLLVHDPAHQSLKLSLWDSDTITADDEIGSVEVPLASLNLTSGAANDLWLTVEPPQPAQHRWDWLVSWCRPRRPSKDWSSHMAQVAAREDTARQEKGLWTAPASGQEGRGQQLGGGGLAAGAASSQSAAEGPMTPPAAKRGMLRRSEQVRRRPRVEAVGLGTGPGAVEGSSGSSGVRERVQLMSAEALRQVAAQGQEAVEQVRQVLSAKPCRLHIQVTYLPFSQDEIMAALEVRRSGPSSLERLSPRESRMYQVLRGGVLFVHLTQARNLAKKDFFLLGGPTKNMQCKLWVGRHKKKTERGRLTNSRNPVFDQTLEFILDADTAADPGTMIHLEIHDINWLFPPDFKGSVSIPLQQVISQQRMRDTWALEGVPSGQVELELEWMGAMGLL